MRRSTWVWLSAVIAARAACLGEESDDRRLVHVAGSTKKVCQLTGDFDRPWNRPTLSRTAKNAGVIGTDLGSSFELGDRLYFLFGDTFGRPGNRDAIAWTRSTDPAQIKLEFLKADDGKFLPLHVPGIRHGGFEVPSYGVAVGKNMYVVFTTDHSKEKVMGRSVLAVSRDQGKTFAQLYELSREKFINVALWKSGKWLYVFGSGPYRASSVCLARIEQGHVENKEMLHYFTDLSDNRTPGLSPDEREAVTLFRHNIVGELSVAYCEPVERYVMLYNSRRSPRGIVMRSAKQPWGPWSEKTVVFDPFRDKGYGHFMHWPSKSADAENSFHDPGRAKAFGGEYGPYLMARYTTGDADRCRIYYTMSTWNPYQVVIVQSDLSLTAKPQ